MKEQGAQLSWLIFAPPVEVPPYERAVLEKRNRRSRSGPAIAQPGGPDGICPIRQNDSLDKQP